MLRVASVAREVGNYAAVGVPVSDIAAIVGMNETTLRKLYTPELKTAGVKATAKVAGKLFQQCMDGNVSAQIFWMKTRGRWSENHIESDGQDVFPVTVVIGKKSARMSDKGADNDNA